jgi:hypothetical protein
MGRAKLTRQEITALIVTMRNELKILFEELQDETSLADYKPRTESIINNLSYLIEQGLNTDPETKDVYSLFDK